MSSVAHATLDILLRDRILYGAGRISELPQLVRESGIDAPRRAARLRARGGVPAVLAEISRIQSSGVKRAYFDALLEELLRSARNKGCSIVEADLPDDPA